jgi:hypothetical protein
LYLSLLLPLQFLSIFFAVAVALPSPNPNLSFRPELLTLFVSSVAEKLASLPIRFSAEAIIFALVVTFAVVFLTSAPIRGCQASDRSILSKINDIHVPFHLAHSAMLNRDGRRSPGREAGVFPFKSWIRNRFPKEPY